MSSIFSGLINLAGSVTGTLKAINGGLATNASAFTGVVKAVSGVFSAATIVNADVDAAAAIDGSKLVAATGGVPGAVTITTQTFGGNKTLTGTTTIGTAASAQTHIINGFFTHGDMIQSGRVFSDRRTPVAGSGGTTSFALGKGFGFLCVRVSDTANDDRSTQGIYFYSFSGSSAITTTAIGSAVNGTTASMAFALSSSGTSLVVTNNATQTANVYVAYYGTLTP